MGFIAFTPMYNIAYKGTLDELWEQIEDSGYDFEDFDFYSVEHPVTIEKCATTKLVLA